MGALDARAEAAIAALAGNADLRVLRRVALPDGRADGPGGAGTMVGAAIDCETTGLDHDVDMVIELAMRRFRFDRDGRIVALDRPHAWRQDPGRPLDPGITRITGLTDADLAGRSIDVSRAASLLGACDLIVAHNSAFDALFVEAAVPGAAGLAWGCSMDGVDWTAHGFEGRSLGWLMAQCGWFYRAHRAGDDVDALVELLRHELDDGATVLSHVLASSSRPGWLVSADGAHFERRGALRERGYRWHGAGKVWRREVADDELDDERDWLAREIYAPGHRPRQWTASFERVDARNRYRLH